jgi:hypothetical protein
MGLSVDDIVAKFPVKTLPRILGEPDYANISGMIERLYGNAASLPSPLGGGAHGHIGILMSVPLYATLSATNYIDPTDPGATPHFPARATDAARDTIRHAHTEKRRVFENHNNMDDALKAQVIDSVEDTYLCELRNKYTGYLGISTRDLCDHLLDRYGKITPADIETCKQRMNEPMDATQPIDAFFQRIDDCVQYAADGKVGFTSDQILQTAYHAVSATGFYNDACKEWRKKAPLAKTWATFKAFFATEYHDLKEQQKVNVQGNKFHNANAAIEAIDIGTALDNLALAATADRDIVTQLTAANHQLTLAVKQLTDQLQRALATNTTLVNKLGNPITTPATTPKIDNRPGRAPFDRAAWEASLDPNGYCWSHGYRVVHGHSSQNCKTKLQHHNDNATRADIQGGSTKGKDKA